MEAWKVVKSEIGLAASSDGVKVEMWAVLWEYGLAGQMEHLSVVSMAFGKAADLADWTVGP